MSSSVYTSVCSLLAIFLPLLLFMNSQAYAANNACMVAATQSKPTNIETTLGADSISLRLAAAEALHKFGSASNNKVQIDYKFQVLLSAIVAGHLSDEQVSAIEKYGKLLGNIEQNSKLANRLKLSSFEESDVVPETLSDVLVSAYEEPTEVQHSKLKAFFSFFQTDKKSKAKKSLEKKFGPVLSYLHAEQMVSVFRNYNKGERLALLKYMLEPVEILSPKEVLTLVKELSHEAQIEAFNFLKAKIIGRFDFYNPAFLSEIDIHQNPALLLAILAHSGSKWHFEDVVKIINKISDSEFNNEAGLDKLVDTLKVNYNEIEVENYLSSQTNIEYREAQLILLLLLANAHNDLEAKKYYTDINEKLYHPEDKKNLEKLFLTKLETKGKINSAQAKAQAKDSQSPFKLKNIDFSELKIKASGDSYPGRTEDIAKVLSVMEYNIQSGNITTVKEFTMNLNRIFLRDFTLANNVYAQGVLYLWRKYADEFINLNPTNVEFRNVIEQISNVETGLELVSARLKSNKIKSPLDFLETLQVIYSLESYREGLLDLWEDHFDQFIALNPTDLEFHLAETSNAADIELKVKLKEAKAKRDKAKMDDNAQRDNAKLDKPSFPSGRSHKF